MNARIHPATKSCLICGVIFGGRHSRGAVADTCSTACGYAFRAKRLHESGGVKSLRQRFEAKVRKSPSCWEWVGSRALRGGYGAIGVRVAGKSTVRTASRVAWELYRGPIPEGMHVLHRCDNPPCCRPDHLFLGTHQDNVADMLEKGRARHGAPRRGEHNACAKLTAEIVLRIRALRANGFLHREIAEATSTNKSTVADVLKGRTWTHL